MSDEAETINRILDEHHKLRDHVRLAGDTINDIGAILSLRREARELSQGSPEDITEKQGQLQQTISFLQDGLKNHFAFEENALPPLLGTAITKGLMIEHQTIKGRIDQAKSMAFDLRLEGLNQDQLSKESSRVQQTIDDLSRLIEEHVNDEETILKMLKKGL